MCVIVLSVLLGGFAARQRESHNYCELRQFLNTPRVQVVSSTTATSDLYVLVYAALRRKDQPIATNNLRTTASNLEHGAALLTSVARFKNIDGLRAGTCLEDFIP